MTPVFCCGAACQFITTLVGPAAGHWSVLGTTKPTIDTTIVPPNGVASFKWVADNANTSTELIQVIAQTTASVRFYVYFDAWPSGSVTFAKFQNANGVPSLLIGAGGVMTLYNFGGVDATVQTLSLATWYRIDWKVDASGATLTETVTVDGANSTTVTHTQASVNLTSFACGPNTTGNTLTSAAVHFGHFLIAALADYPIGPGYVQGFRVQATSGTHSQTAGDFQNDAGTNITNGDGSGAKLNETTPDTTSFIKEVATGTPGGYVEYIYATGSGGIPRAVEQVVAVKNVSLTTANNEKSQLYDGTTASDAYALTSIGSTSLIYRTKQWASPPSGGSWTAALFALLRIRWGFSTDIVPVPAISWTILEAEFAPSRLPAELNVRQAVQRSSVL